MVIGDKYYRPESKSQTKPMIFLTYNTKIVCYIFNSIHISCQCAFDTDGENVFSHQFFFHYSIFNTPIPDIQNLFHRRVNFFN